MLWKKFTVSWHKFWSSRTPDDGEQGRKIIERLLELSRHPPIGTSSERLILMIGENAKRPETIAEYTSVWLFACSRRARKSRTSRSAR